MMPDLSQSAETRRLSIPRGAARVFRLLPVVAGLVLPAALIFLAGGCGRGKPEARHKGDLPYAVLDKAFQPLRRDFEDADGKVRLVGIVAPTCGECIDFAAAIDQMLLPAIPGEDFEVFLVWVCVVPPDVDVRARALAEKYADPRIRHYWDGTGRIGRAFGRHAGLADGASAYGLFYLYGRPDTWDPEGKMSGEPPGVQRHPRRLGARSAARARGKASAPHTPAVQRGNASFADRATACGTRRGGGRGAALVGLPDAYAAGSRGHPPHHRGLCVAVGVQRGDETLSGLRR